MVFAPTYSILTGGANYSNYEALEDTIVLQIQYSVLESFIQNTTRWSTWGAS